MQDHYKPNKGAGQGDSRRNARADGNAVARVLCGMEVATENLSEPLSTVLREVMSASDKVATFKDSAKRHDLQDADALLKAAQAADPNQAPEAKSLIALMSSDEILNTTFPEPAWAVPNILPVGLTVLAGAAKIGKSWLALQIALSVATGGMVFNERVARGGVLCLALEDSPRRLQERMRKQGWTLGLTAEFLTVGRFESEIGYLRNGGAERLANQIKTKGYRYVAIDTLSRAVEGDQNDAQEMTRGLTPLQEIAHQCNCAVVLIDHHRKGNGENPDTIADILGSTAKGAMADTVWGLYRERGKRGARLKITGRDLEERTLSLKMDYLTGAWQSEGEARELEMTVRLQEIIDAVAKLGTPTLKQIADEIGQDKSNTRKRLADLANRGVIQYTGDKYSLA